MSKRIEKQIRILPTVESEGHFGAIGLEMLRANFMPRSENPALQKGECGFNSIGMNVAFYVDVQFVSDGFVPPVPAKMFRRAPVSVEIVRKENLDIFADIFADEFFQRAAFHVRCVEKAKVAAALPDADDVLFIVPSGLLAFAAIHTADERLVHFDFAIEHRPLTFGQSCADSMAEEPCGLVTDSERALNLTGAHSLFRFAEQVRRGKPFFERKVSVIENRARSHGELIAA